MEDKNRILFSAQRQVVRRKVKYFQRILSICLLVCATYLVWYRMDSREVARKNQELQQIARQTMEERQRDTGEDSGEEDALPGEPEKDGGQEAETETEETRESVPETPQESPYITGYDRLLQINPDLKGWISIPGQLYRAATTPTIWDTISTGTRTGTGRFLWTAREIWRTVCSTP